MIFLLLFLGSCSSAPLSVGPSPIPAVILRPKTRSSILIIITARIFFPFSPESTTSSRIPRPAPRSGRTNYLLRDLAPLGKTDKIYIEGREKKKSSGVVINLAARKKQFSRHVRAYRNLERYCVINCLSILGTSSPAPITEYPI